MSVFGKVQKSTSAVEEKDVLGGGYQLAETDIYSGKIQVAYVTKAASGAMAVNVQIALAETGTVHRETIYFTNRAGQTFYVDKKSGEERNLPGFSTLNAMSLLAVGKELLELDSDERIINVYSYDAQGEVPTKVDMLTDLLGEEIYVAIVKQTVDKTAKADDGSYQPTGETKEENVIEKFFRMRDKKTTSEVIAQVEEAVFFDSWLEKNKGKDRNKAKGVAAGAKAGAPTAATASSTPKAKTSLFS